MKNTVKRFGFIAIVAIIGLSMATLSLTGCEGPEGPSGPEGPQGPAGGMSHIYDKQGRDVGVILYMNSSSQYVVNKNGYTFYISAASLTSQITSTTIRATETNGTGTLICLEIYASQNAVIKNNGEYYRYKDRDANGYINGTATVYTSYASYRDSTSTTWTNSSGTGARYEIEKITEATDDAYFIGFIPEYPLRIVW